MNSGVKAKRALVTLATDYSITLAHFEVLISEGAHYDATYDRTSIDLA